MNGEKPELSHCETLIMKTIWDAKEELCVQELIHQIYLRYGKDYARTTVVTFLGKLMQKGFIATYRKGKIAYIKVLREEEAYKQELLQTQIDFWYNGDPLEMTAALCRSGAISKADAKKVEEALSDVD